MLGKKRSRDEIDTEEADAPSSSAEAVADASSAPVAPVAAPEEATAAEATTEEEGGAAKRQKIDDVSEKVGSR